MIASVYHVQAIGMQSKKKQILNELHNGGFMHINILEDNKLHRDHPVSYIEQISSSLLELQWIAKHLNVHETSSIFSNKSLDQLFQESANIRKKLFIPLKQLITEKKQLQDSIDQLSSVVKHQYKHRFDSYAGHNGRFVSIYVIKMNYEEYISLDLPGVHSFENDRAIVTITKQDQELLEKAVQGFEIVAPLTISSNEIKQAKSALPKLRTKLEKIQNQIISFHQQLSSLPQIIHDFTIYFDRYSIADSMLRTDYMFVFDGYIDVKDYAAFERISKLHKLHVISKKPHDAPSKLSNGSYVKHFSFLVKMFGVPRYGYVDPTPFLSIFFPLFFGLMFSDIGYGLFLTIMAVVLVKKSQKHQKVMKDGAVVLAACGLTTVVFGILFGSFLGGLIPINALLFNPFDNSQMMLVLALGFGLIHLIIGLLINSYQYLSKKMIRSFVTEPLPMLVLIGMGIAFGVQMMNLGFVLLVLSILLLYLKAKIMGMLDITGFFGNWMSYARLLALAMATGGIGMAINILAENTLALGAIGGVLYILILIGGHLFNFLMNILGSSIHAIRLHYIEFFAQFYAGGGEEFVAYSTKREIETL